MNGKLMSNVFMGNNGKAVAVAVLTSLFTVASLHQGFKAKEEVITLQTCPVTKKKIYNALRHQEEDLIREKLAAALSRKAQDAITNSITKAQEDDVVFNVHIDNSSIVHRAEERATEKLPVEIKTRITSAEKSKNIFNALSGISGYVFLCSIMSLKRKNSDFELMPQ